MVDIQHYTNASGLLGIINNDAIWGTAHTHLNDYFEYDFGVQILSEYIFKEQYLPEHLKSQCDSVRAHFQRNIREFSDRNTMLFVSSFYVPDDKSERIHGSLSQWRAYGGGFAIVFDDKSLTDLFNQQHTDSVMASLAGGVIYGGVERETKEYIEKYRDKIIDLSIKDWSKENIDDIYELLKLAISSASLIKHPAFNSEKEFRLARLLPLGRHRRQSANMISHMERRDTLVPYIVNVKSITSTIKRIIVAPKHNRDNAANSIRLLLDSKGVEHIDIQISDIPTREL